MSESACNKVYSQETSKQVFSGETLENLNTDFEEHLSTVSENTSRVANELHLRDFAF